MDFQTENHREAYARLDQLLVESFGRQHVLAHRLEPKFLIELGDPTTIVTVDFFKGIESSVSISHLLDKVIVPDDPKERMAMLTYFLRESDGKAFCTFALHEDSGVHVFLLKYSLLASLCTAEGLYKLILASHKQAERYNSTTFGRTIHETRFVSGQP